MLIYWIFYVGYYMVIMMADITTIDESYYEAATIDGATDFQNTTSTIVLYMYKKLQDSNYGMAGASAVILIIVGVVFIVCIRALFEGRGDKVKVKKGRAGR